MVSHCFLCLYFPCFLLLVFVTCCFSHSSLFGIHPLDEKYYSSEVIKCKDGSKSFSRDRLNDNFCDCPDGTDEPGTSACPNGKFYCKNLGSKPQFIVSSHVNDHFCDCCDGSDEYDGNICCPNTCVMGGNAKYTISNCKPKASQNGVKSEESIYNLTGFMFVLDKVLQYYINLSTVLIGSTKHHGFLLHFCPFSNQCPSIRPLPPLQKLEQAVGAQVVAENLEKFQTFSFP